MFVTPGNPSGIEPTEFNVLIKPLTVEGHVFIKGPDGKQFKIYKPDDLRDKEQVAATEGQIIAVSPLAFGYETWPATAHKPEPGDRVFFAKYAGMKITGRDNESYLVVKDKDIAAILTDKGDDA